MANHYIRLDADSKIIYGYSDADETPQAGDILLRQDVSGPFMLFPPDGLRKISFNPMGTGDPIYPYRYFDGQVVPRAAEEIEAELPVLRPVASDAERLDELERIIHGIIQALAESRVIKAALIKWGVIIDAD